MRTLALSLATWMLLSPAVQSIFVLYALEALHLSDSGYGLLLAFGALGGILGSVVATRVLARVGYPWALAGAILLGAPADVVLAVSTAAAGAAIGLVLEGVAVVV